MSEESPPSIDKLPLEVMGLILLKLGDDSDSAQQLEEIKKIRIISPRWYKAVQVLYQDQLFHKCMTHFDGREYTYGQSTRFGLNVFGKFPLDFATLKISNSEYYLVKSCLSNMVSNNLQNLILQDNHLNLKELLEVLKNFPNIVNLEFVQSSEKMCVAKKIYELYANITDDKSDIEIIEMIKSELGETDNFLQNLKSINFKIIHPSIMNFVILIISCGQCELEEISIEFDIKGITWSMWQFFIYKIPVNFKNFEIGSMMHLNKFSKSFKKIKITAMSSLMNSVNHFGGTVEQNVFSRLCQSIFNIFNENQLKDLKNIKELQINMWRHQFSQNNPAGLLDFIKNQNNLSKVQVGMLSESFGSNQGQSQDDQVQLKKKFLEILNSFDVNFGYQVSIFGLESIVRYSENLINLEVDIYPTSHWRFSHYQITFPNCKSLIIRNLCPSDEINDRWSNFQVPVIIKKFPNLTNLEIEDKNVWEFFGRPQISNEDFQSIIKNYPNIEKIRLYDCVIDLCDSGLTGLTAEALEVRKNSPDLPITPEERTGLPISHLKNLTHLMIFKNHMTYIHNWPAPATHEITDLSTIYGFQDQVSKLKCLSFYNTPITETGIEVLKSKLPSNCQLTADSVFFLH